MKTLLERRIKLQEDALFIAEAAIKASKELLLAGKPVDIIKFKAAYGVGDSAGSALADLYWDRDYEFAYICDECGNRVSTNNEMEFCPKCDGGERWRRIGGEK